MRTGRTDTPPNLSRRIVCHIPDGIPGSRAPVLAMNACDRPEAAACEQGGVLRLKRLNTTQQQQLTCTAVPTFTLVGGILITAVGM